VPGAASEVDAAPGYPRRLTTNVGVRRSPTYFIIGVHIRGEPRAHHCSRLPAWTRSRRGGPW